MAAISTRTLPRVTESARSPDQHPNQGTRAGAAVKYLARRFARLAGSGLAPRAMALSVLLLLAVQGAGLVAVRASIDRNARAQLATELAVGERIWQRLLEQNAQRLRQGALLLSADPAFRAAIGSGDAAGIGAGLDGHGARAGATVAALLDAALQPRLVQAGTDDGALTPALLRELATPLARESGGGRIVLLNGRPHQLVATPLRTPAPAGWVVMGAPLGQALAEDLHTLSGLQVALLAEPAGGTAQLVASTLDAAAGPALLAQSSPAARGLVVDGDEVLTRTVMQEAGPGALRTLLMRPLVDATRPYRPLYGVLLAVMLLGAGLFAWATRRAVRSVTMPLRSLQRASERLGRGEYAVPAKHTERGDEVGELAQAFDQMRLGIAASQAEVRRLAYVDRLTGLPNRARFRDATLAAIGRDAKPGRSVAVLMLDLDRFKHVNDVLGYAWGDRLLVAVSQRLTAEAGRGGGVVGRYGADEFALLLPGADAEAALGVVQRIAAAFAQPLTLDDQTVDLSACFGVASWPAHAEDADALLARAEVALYAAKRQAEGPVVYDPGLDAASAQTLSLMSALRRAVEAGELRLYLQPKVELATGAVVGAEGLLRWQHPTRGLLLPAQFVPFAEQNGFVRRLTLWVFEELCRCWSGLQAHGPLRLSVNLSTRDLLDTELPARLEAIAKRHGVEEGGLCLEIAESAIALDAARAEAALGTFSRSGFKLAIDDFGTGYSSLALLKRLPIDELKIERSFVAAMGRSADDAEVVQSTVELARTLGLVVVAEGIEHAASYRRLEELDCDEGQGTHISEPLPAADFAAWAVRWSGQLGKPAVPAA
jgi:diguanylate cyclase (GGDEF)-like protein